jgi:hypothetical protein
MAKVLAFAERSGVRELLALVPADGAVQGLLLVHGFEAVAPVYHFRLDPESAESTARGLARLLPAEDVTRLILNQHGKVDLDRIDKLTRNISRGGDHLFWIKSRESRATFVRQGARIAAYGLGGANQVGPIAGTTQDAALAALGHALLNAFESKPNGAVEVRIPAPFRPAIEALMDAGARIHSTSVVYGRETALKFDRLAFGTPALP